MFDNEMKNNTVSHKVTQEHITYNKGGSMMDEMKVNTPNANEGTTNQGGSMTTSNNPQQESKVAEEQKTSKRKSYDGSRHHGVKADTEFKTFAELNKAVERIKLRGRFLKSNYDSLNSNLASDNLSIEEKVNMIEEAESTYSALFDVSDLLETIQAKRQEVESLNRQMVENYVAKSTDTFQF